MTVERAIEILNPEHREHYNSIDPVIEACRMGMEALLERMNREKGCEYCKNGAEFGYFDIRKEYGWYELYGYNIFGEESSATIDFCPYCGRLLKGDET